MSINKLPTLLFSIWSGLMVFTVYKLFMIPELADPKSISQQIEHYHPYGELAAGLVLVSILAKCVAASITPAKLVKK